MVIIIIIAAILVCAGASVLCAAMAAGQSTRKGKDDQVEPDQIPELRLVKDEQGCVQVYVKAPRKRGRFSFIILLKHKLSAT
jgi:hypothetical protein